MWKEGNISNSKNCLLHLVPEISPKYFISNMPTAEEFAIRKHGAVPSATCQLENTPPEKESTSLSRGRRAPVIQDRSGSRSKLHHPFTEGKETFSTSTVMLKHSIYSFTQAYKPSEKHDFQTQPSHHVHDTCSLQWSHSCSLFPTVSILLYQRSALEVWP